MLGLAIGFTVAELFKLDFHDLKAVSIEVGMQNSGLGATLTPAYFSPVAAVPSAIFSVWHNISGPILATWWGKNNENTEPPVGKGEKIG